MATNYPGSLDTGTQQPSPSASTEMDDSGFEHDAVHTNHSGAIIALETKVGTGDSTAVANSVLAGTGSGTSAWTTGTLANDISGNAATATALETARTINGTSFDGTANITVTAAAGTLTGSTLNSGVTASSLTSVGTLTSLGLSGDTTSTGHFTAQSGGADSGIVLGQAFSTGYVGLRTAGMSETSSGEYILISDGGTTLLSGGTGSDVYVRAGGNSSTHQIHLDHSAATTNFAGDANFDSGTLFVDVSANRVGINDTSPSYDLDVAGSIRATADIYANDEMYVGANGGGDSPIHFYDDNSNTWRTLMWDDSQNGFYFEGPLYPTVGTAALPAHSFSGDKDTGMYRSASNQLSFSTGGSEAVRIPSAGDLRLQREGVVIDASGKSYWSLSPPTGTGNDAEWTAAFGFYYLRRNSSTAAEKVNIQTDLEGWLTPQMIDSVVPKMWARTETPDFPEIGPIAEDMDAISPFLGTKGTDGEGEVFLNGIDRNAYLSLLVLAVKDLRARVAELESAS